MKKVINMEQWMKDHKREHRITWKSMFKDNKDLELINRNIKEIQKLPEFRNNKDK